MSGARINVLAITIIFLFFQPLSADRHDLSHDTTSSGSELPRAGENIQPDTSTPDSAFVARSSDPGWWDRQIANTAFAVGESLEFAMYYGMIPAGNAKMLIPELIDYNGKKCFRIMSIASSNGFVSTFYRVRDTVESYVDLNGIFPYYYRKHLREGGYRADRTTIFDQKRHLAITGKDTIPTYSFVQDALSSLYFVRTQKIEPGQDIMIDNHTDRKNYPLRIIVHGREKIKVPAGEFECLVVEPVMRYEGIFKAKGAIKIWLTDDQFKMPVKMQTEVFFLGSIIAKLKKFKRGVPAIEDISEG